MMGDWEMVNMIEGSNNKKVVTMITDKEKWRMKKALDDEFWATDLGGKI